MQQLVLVVHVILAAVLVGFILLQQGKGADAGAAFGSGASGTVFGSRGTGGFLSRTTSILALLFFATSSYLAYFHARDGGSGKSIVDSLAGEEAALPSIGPSDIPEIDLNSEVPILPTDKISIDPGNDNDEDVVPDQ